MIVFTIHCILQTPHCNFQVGCFIYCNFSFYGKSTPYETYFTFFFLLFAKVSNDITSSGRNERQVAIDSFC